MSLGVVNVDVALAAGPSTEVEKGTAAALLGVTAGQDLLDLSDRDFTSAMYRIADEQDKPRPTEPEHQKVKQAAIDALTVQSDPACTPCTTYIKTGMAAAHQEDVTIVNDRRQQQEKERKTKAEAAKAIGLTEDRYTPELGRSVHDFIVFIDLNADNHKDIAVRNAARAALQGSDEKQWSFLAVEIFTAHKDDVARLIQEDNAKTEAEKAAAIAEEKKAAAAYQALGVIADDKMRKLNDDDFCRTIYRLAPKDSEVFIAARDAVLSLEPTDRTKFIETGAADARQRDIDNELRRRDQERVKQITAIRDAAVRAVFRTELVNAANAALAGGPISRERFLRTGQHQHDIQTIRGTSETLDMDVYLADEGSGALALTKWKPGTNPKLSWKVEPGLADPSCLSFQSVTRPNHYIRWLRAQSQFVMARADVAPVDGTDEFRTTATWCANFNGTNRHNVLSPTMRGVAMGLYVPGVRVDNSLRAAATWTAEAPQPPSPIDRAYNENSATRAMVGKPVAEAVFDAEANGYREYEQGVLHLRHDNPRKDARVFVVSGKVYQKYRSLGGPTGTLAHPTGPETDFGNKIGQVQRFFGGAVYNVVTPADATHVGTYGVVGHTYAKYVEVGSENGVLGYPTSDIKQLPDGIGWATTFSGNGGAIYHHPSIGAKVIYGNIRWRWNQLGAEKSWLGYPTSDEFDLPKGRRNTFQNGRIDFSNDGGGTIEYKTVPIAPRAIAIKGVESHSCIQIAGVGQDALRDGAGAELWQCVPGAPKQIWDVIPVGDNKYQLKNRNSGKCLDVYNSNLDNNGLIMQHSCHNGLNQQWELTTDNTGGNYALRAVHSAKTADGRGSAPFNGKPVAQWADSGTNSQRWTVVPQ
ncbi:hypothetical protein ALI144C_17495 [Actinosynnema sp. ALI-1.44]|uniref:RICIN domain-containing protein n=1 Tax=Actinosynnema sp. ALI-1.44 TaxID=1933779 RepID=UPI00097C304A|nr:RICIN domain-containing protein [Actinosynnema sp. ALI-1.44]ONI82861.1 hypothetical protein ALI144C_17495 [Actinosynnema sp. ALI-1.44]